MIKTLKYFYTVAWREKPAYLFLIAAGILLNAGHPFVNLILPKYLLEELAGARRMDVIILLIAGTGIGNLVFLCLIHLVETNIAKYNTWFGGYFYDRLSEKAMTIDYPLTESAETLNQRRKAWEGMAWYSNGLEGLSACFQRIVSNTLTTVGVVSIVALSSPILLVVAIFAVAGGSLAVRQTNKLQRIQFEEFPKVDRAYAYMLNDMVDVKHGKSIRLYDAVSMIHDKMDETGKKIWHIFYYTDNCMGRWNCMGSAVNFFKSICIYGYLGVQLLKGVISIGDFTMLSGAANTLKDSLQGILNEVQDLHKKLKFMHEYEKFMEIESGMVHKEKKVGLQETPSIVFENVSFRYPSAEEYTLKNVSITIRPGEHLSVVGLNGAGKTTFIKLLCRLYDVSGGRILVNGVDIREYDEEEYRRLLSVVFQDFKMFALSMRENIRLGDWEKEEGDMDHVCRLSGIQKKADSLPLGLDTQIYKYFDENGMEPSGGEMQKMAIARALYKDAPVVILDEPTAALDPVAEYEIYRQFDTLVGGKTAIYISHRLSSCKFCDKIAVFSENTIKEYGTHEELVRRTDGIYAEMFAAQAQYYA